MLKSQSAVVVQLAPAEPRSAQVPQSAPAGIWQ
jgi:hypothetical protein